MAVAARLRRAVRGASSASRTIRRAAVGRPRLTAAVLAATAGLAAYLLSVSVFPYHTSNHDEGVYLQQAAMLLEGDLFLRPPVPEAFRPWFFVAEGDALYSKYSPAIAAVFAGGALLGGYRIALALVAAAVVWLVAAVVREAFDARTGLVAAGFVLVSPLFLIQTSVFLPYAPTAVWNLLFALASLRADRYAGSECAGSPGLGLAGVRRRALAYAALAGAAAGVAFFSRPYTAVLFAAPFVAHALWTLRDPRGGGPLGIARDAAVRHAVTAAFGLAGVALALGYNAVVTGDPLLFPYEAFAPRDGLGFGRREILGYAREYTPALALRANAEVLWLLATRWLAGGPLGTLLAAVGVGALLSRHRSSGTERVQSSGAESARSARSGDGESAPGAVRRFDARRAVLAGVVVSVAVGNVYFWGTLNVLGDLADPGDGLVSVLGPFYHFDLLLPLSAFGAHGLLSVLDRARSRLRILPSARARAVGLAVLLVTGAVGGGAVAATLASPVADNAATTEQYERAYAPFEERSLDGALVFLPTPYGDWLNHPFQALRNDPGYDGDVVYALRERQFDVVDAFPGRTRYRYTYRGEWAPQRGQSVVPRLQPVEAVRGERVRLAATLGVPAGAERVSIRLVGDGDSASFAANGTGTLSLRVQVADGRARLSGPDIEALGGATVRAPEDGELVAEVLVDFGGASALTYRIELPVAADGSATRALTPYLEVCADPRDCGGEAAYVPGEHRPGVFVLTSLTADDESNSPRTATTATPDRVGRE